MEKVNELPACCALCDWHMGEHPLLGEYYTWQCAVHGVMCKLWPYSSQSEIMTAKQFGLRLNTLIKSAGVRGEGNWQ
jgi:hypothetical protein